MAAMAARPRPQLKVSDVDFTKYAGKMKFTPAAHKMLVDPYNSGHPTTYNFVTCCCGAPPHSFAFETRQYHCVQEKLYRYY